MKRIILVSLLVVISTSLTLWKEVGSGSPPVLSAALTGPNQGLIVQGDTSIFRVHRMDWVDDTNPITNSVKSIDVGANSNMVTTCRVQSDSGYNSVVTCKNIFRFSTEPSAPNDFEEYPVPNGFKYSYPFWTAQTNYMFVSAREAVSTGDKKLYRLHTDRVTDIKVFNTGTNTQSFGILYGTNWLVVSIKDSTERRLYDYTNGYIGGSNTAVQTHPKQSTYTEIGFMSPEDGRGYYVVGIYEWKGQRKIYTVKNDGTDLLNHDLSSIDKAVMFTKWIHDTDLCVVSSWGVNFAIVNFMDTTKPAPTFYTLPSGAKKIYQAQIWKDYRAITLPAEISARSYVYKALTEMPCSELCVTCEGIYRKKCLSCSLHSTQSGDVCNCDPGYYASDASPTKKECLACSTLCGRCSGGSATNCLTCKYSWMEKKGDGRCGCPLGKYLSGTSCLDCDSSCETCSGAGPSACLSCSVSSGRYLSGSKCLNCDISWKTCSGAGSSACLSCDVSNGRFQSGTSCPSCDPSCMTCSGWSSNDCLSCDTSTGRFSSGSKCLPCDSSCKTFSGPGPSDCLTCDSDAVLSDNQCIKSCPQTNQFLDNQKTCKDCPAFCEKCNDIIGTCSRCKDGFVLLLSENSCQRIENPLFLKRVDYSSTSQTLKISFNQLIITPRDLNSALKIELKHPQSSTQPYQVKHKEINLDDSGSRIIIKFEFKKENQSFTDYEIVITEITESTIKAQRNPRDIFKAFPITQKGVTYIKSRIADISVTAAKGTSYSLNILSIILLLISLSLAVIMIKLFQLLFFLLFININLPSNIGRFIYSFKKNILDYFPTFVRIGANPKMAQTTNSINRIIEEKASGRANQTQVQRFCFPHHKLEENDQTCSVFVNLGSFITQLVIFLILKLLVYALKKIYMSTKNKNNISIKPDKNGLGNKQQKETIQKIQQKDTRPINEEEKNQKDSQVTTKKVRNQIGILGPNSPMNKFTKDLEASDPARQNNRPNQLNIFNLNSHNNKQINWRRNSRRNKNKQDSQTSSTAKLLDKIDTFLNMAYFFNMFKAMQLKAVIGATTSILSIYPWAVSGIANLVFSILTILFYFILILWIAYLVCSNIDIKTSQNPICEKKKIGINQSLFQTLELLKELKEQSKDRKSMRAILALSIIQDFFIPLGLTIFVEVPAVQIITAIIFMTFCFFTVIRQRPFRKVETNLLEAGNRAIYILILLVFFLNHVLGDISEEARFNYIGFGIIGLISLLIGFNIGISVWVIVKKIKKLLSKKKDGEKNKKESQIEPIGKEEISVEQELAKGEGNFEEPERSKNKTVNGFEFLDDQSMEEIPNQLQADNQPFKPIIFNPFLSEKKELNHQREGKRPNFEKEFDSKGKNLLHFLAKKTKINKRMISFDKQRRGESTIRDHLVKSTKLDSRVQDEEEEEKGVDQDLEELMLD